MTPPQSRFVKVESDVDVIGHVVMDTADHKQPRSKVLTVRTLG